MIMTAAAAATGSSSFLSHPELCDDLDAQPLTLSGHGDLDDFDFLLDIDEDDAIAASAYNSEDGIIMDIPFRSTRSTTTARFETMDESSSSSSSSLNGTMHLHTIEETGSSSGSSAGEREEMLSLPSYSSNGNSGYYQPGRDRGRQQQQQQQEHFRVNHQVNFDPPMQQQQRYQQAGSLPRCQASVSDMSACSYATAHSSSTAFSHHDRYQPGHHDAAVAVAASHRSSSFAHSTEAPRQDQQQHLQQRPANPVRQQHRHYLQQQAQQQQQQQQQQCRSAEKSLQLQKLAESMRRTERSRRRVMMHRDSMSAEQRSMQLRALREMKEAQQRRQYHQVQNHQAQNHHQAQQREQEQRQGQHQMMQQQRRTSRSPDAGDGCDNHQQQQQYTNNRSSIVTAFFSGSRSTLTNGLEHSRRQLGLLYHMSTI